jgi:mRNA-degrading endonuclease HigB of HigAB toxin-antitoxin module
VEEHEEQTWAIWAMTRRVENAQYEEAASVARSFPDQLLTEAKTSLEFMLDIVGNEQRRRKSGGKR